MSLSSCPHCGAARISFQLKCSYCGGLVGPAPKRKQDWLKQIRGRLNESNVGFQGHTALIRGMLIGAVVLYGLGWLLEDPQYWLAESAIFVWGIGLPLYLMGLASLWRMNRIGWHVGLLFALLVFLIHTGMMWGIRGSLQDDHLGIASIFAGAALLGWLVGRVIHLAVVMRRYRLHQQDMHP